jgi:plastocyanin
VNGGNTPSYQWKLNGNNIPGAIYSPYQSSSLANGDVVSVVMTSSMACASPSSATSNGITMTVHQVITPSVSITASATSICPGQAVTFTANTRLMVHSTEFQWVKNGVLADVASLIRPHSLANGDSVYVILYNTTDCIPNSDVISNVIHITVSQTVIPSVSIHRVQQQFATVNQ